MKEKLRIENAAEINPHHIEGLAILKRDLTPADFNHTAEEQNRFPYDQLKKGGGLTLKMNVSTHPFTYGFYVNDTCVFGIDSPLVNDLDLYFVTPPFMPLWSYDEATQRRLIQLHQAQIRASHRKVGHVSKVDDANEPTFTLDLTNLYASKLLFRSLLLTGCLPTQVVTDDLGKPQTVIMTYAIKNEAHVESFLACYPHLPSELFEDYA